ncbi:GNAT family N-acetyltransferase [Nocardia alba]|uniref:Acetyltransferase (GNAT) family protein n=1 Tax=Nocardia alba TaxID=225051 RepID=A0A4V2PBY5_9NOCA|nr:GNAT family N-acetyltransferase [Nocardia alba]TCJ99255.1 acetyltransferase (GNAT) family protein [Nocardia alba]
MSDWRIAPLTANRVTELAACHIASWREAYNALVPAHILDGFDLERSAVTWERRRAAGTHRLPVALVGDRLIGFAAGTDSPVDARPVPPRAPTEAELEALYVRSTWHGTGIADALLAAAAPRSPCTLWVFGDYPRAHAFYRRHGFTDTGIRRTDPFTLLPEQLWRREPG